jgi:hypothetical protein
MAFDSFGNLYVANGAKVSEYSPNGTYLGAFADQHLDGATFILITGPYSTVWNGSNGNWTDAARWSTGPNFPSNGTPSDATYEAIINSGSISLNTPTTITSLKLLGGSLAGVGNLTINNATVNGTYNLLGITTVNTGTLTFNGSSQQAGLITGSGALQVNAGATLTSDGVTIAGSWQINGTHTIRTGTGNQGTSKVSSLPAIAFATDGFTISFSGTLNLADAKLILQSSSNTDKLNKIQSLNTAIDSGVAGGSWSGHGITSSVAAADPAHLSIGVFENALLNNANFGGLTVDPNSILIALAHLGDANDNGIVDIQDQSIVSNNWQKSSNSWSAGDLNRDGVVDIQDLTIVTNNWQEGSSIDLAGDHSFLASPVPEPASLTPLSLCWLYLVKRRRARHHRSGLTAGL